MRARGTYYNGTVEDADISAGTENIEGKKKRKKTEKSEKR